MSEVKIALTGNPNCGKTTIFNELTGSNQYVGNWPGVTVEKKEGRLKGNKEVVIQDLPGIYSLSPYTLEEVVTRNYLIQERPDAMIDVVDANNLERNLYLTTQLLEVSVPVVIALNMMDLAEKNKIKIDIQKLSQLLGCQVIETSAVKGKGCAEVAEAAQQLAQKGGLQKITFTYDPKVEKALSAIGEVIKSHCAPETIRWYEVKVFERDSKAEEALGLSGAEKEQIKGIIKEAEEAFDDDSESIITNERYTVIQEIIKDCVVKTNGDALTTSDKIDRIVTNRWLALPIFAVVMFLVYYLSIATVGTMATDWVNDVLFGDIVPGALESFMNSVNTAPWLQSLVLDGIVAGVGAVLGFLPQMAVLFLCLSFLEDCGYMSRIAFIMDRIFRRFGLSGKSFIPIMIGTGCGVPGIMASRTIENEKDRRMTVMLTTFIPCSAKLPVIAMIAGAIFNDSPWVAASAYFIGIAAILFSGIVLKKTRLFAGDPAPFVMELPAYHMPQFFGVIRTVWDRLWSFIKRAGTIILLSSVIIWLLMRLSWSFQFLDKMDVEDSILASIGRVVGVIFAPLGWGDWRATVSTISGLVAKENIIGTMGVVYQGIEDAGETGEAIWGTIASQFTAVSAYSFLVFNLLCAPCFAAIGAIRREMNSAKWTWAAVGYQCGLAYCASLIVFQLGSFFFEGASFGFGQVVAIALIVLGLWGLFRKGSSGSSKTVSAVEANA